MVNYFLYVLIHCSVITSSLKYCNGCLPRTQHPSGKHSSSASNNCPFKNFANSEPRPFQLDSWFLVLGHGQCTTHCSRFLHGMAGAPRGPPTSICESGAAGWCEHQSGWHIAAKAVCKQVSVWRGKDVNELWPCEMGGLGNSTRCQKAPLGQKYGNQFFHTELKLILITNKFISQVSCNLKRTLKVHSTDYSKNHCWMMELVNIPRYLARHV